MSYIIENITEKEVNTKFVPKKAYSVSANGERYGYGFKKPTFSIGDEVDFQFTENAPMYLKQYFDIDFPCQLKVGVEVGKNWQDKTELEL
jgi:hypothetical protein